MHKYTTVMMTMYTTVMMTIPAVTWQDIQGKSEKTILYDIPFEQFVDYKEKTAYIKHCQNKEHP